MHLKNTERSSRNTSVTCSLDVPDTSSNQKCTCGRRSTRRTITLGPMNLLVGSLKNISKSRQEYKFWCVCSVKNKSDRIWTACMPWHFKIGENFSLLDEVEMKMVCFIFYFFHSWCSCFILFCFKYFRIEQSFCSHGVWANCIMGMMLLQFK